MGRMCIKVAGREVFKWSGDEAQIAGLEQAFCQVAAAHRGAAESMAAAAVDDLVSNGLAAKESGQTIHGMAVVYFLLQQDTRTLARPGRIRDYLSAWDFEFDLHRRADGGIRVQIMGKSGSWS